MYTSRAYGPYGENYAAAGAFDVDFTGQNQDTTSGLYDFMFREYSPVQGRWISPDPAGTAAVDMTNPQTWNGYAYVGNNPLSFTDSTGLKLCTECHFLGFGGSGGGCNLDGVATSCDIVNFVLQSDGAATITITSAGGVATTYPAAPVALGQITVYLPEGCVDEGGPKTCYPATTTTLGSLFGIGGGDVYPPQLQQLFQGHRQVWNGADSIAKTGLAVEAASLAAVPIAGEAAILSEGLGWNVSGTWGAFRQFTIYNTYGNLLSLGVDSVNGWHIGILASETGHSLWHIPLNPLNW